jgi:3-oxoacyl-[acyl-carrier protein] reductase
MDTRTLSGHSALITGGGRGVGKGIALALARAGCRVAVNYRTGAEAAAQTVGQIQQLGGDAFAVKADVGVASDVRAMFDEVLERFGRLNAVVNTAGRKSGNRSSIWRKRNGTACLPRT